MAASVSVSEYAKVGVFLLVCIVSLGFLLLIVLPTYSQNKAFALKVFKKSEYSQALASRRMRWFPSNLPWDNCAYAVVELPDSASEGLDGVTVFRMPGVISGGTGWNETPGEMDSGETIYTHWCEKNFSRTLWARMKAAMETGGGWYSNAGSAQLVYSARHRISFVLMPSD